MAPKSKTHIFVGLRNISSTATERKGVLALLLAAVVIKTIIITLVPQIECHDQSIQPATTSHLSTAYFRQYRDELQSATAYSGSDHFIASENFGPNTASDVNEFKAGASEWSNGGQQHDPLPSSSDQVATMQMPSSSVVCEQRHEERQFEIRSDGYPHRNYSNNLDCVHYVVRESQRICALELRFRKFHLEPSEGCAYDFLEIDGESFCGTLPDGSRNIFRFGDKQQVKSISFQTDSQGSAPGFDIEVRQLDDCDNSFIPAPASQLTAAAAGLKSERCLFASSERQDRLTSIRYPQAYPDDILCAYTIQRPAGSNICSVQLRFTQFDLQQSPDCKQDFLELQRERYCGKSLNGTSKIVKFDEQGAVKFLFKTDATGSVDRKGFAIDFTQIECLESSIEVTSTTTPRSNNSTGGEDENEDSHNSKMASLPPTEDRVKMESKLAGSEQNEQSANKSTFYSEPCFQLFEKRKFTLASKQRNGTYGENLDCLYTIRRFSPRVCYLEMYFRKFDLEASPDCQYDYVEIGTAVRLCGTLQRETSRIYSFNREQMFVNFHSDASTERTGFRLEVEQLECDGDRIIREHTTDGEPKDALQSLDSQPAQGPQVQQPRPEKLNQKVQERKEGSSGQVLQQQETSEFDLVDVSGDRVRIPARGDKSSPDQCSKMYEEREFFIHSPRYPGPYPTDIDCLYLIRPYSPSVCKLEINFDHFELQPYDFAKDCKRSDFLDMDSREQLCGKFAESTSKIYSFYNQSFFIHFHADGFPTSFDKGFRLFVRQIDCAALVAPYVQQHEQRTPSGTRHFSRCNKIFTTTSFDVKSPLYPTTYPSNSLCQYRVMKARSDSFKICYLEISFRDFELQDSRNCSKDWISLNGVKLCGTVVRDSLRVFPFMEPEFVITFSSDSTRNKRGFHLQVRQMPCREQILDHEPITSLRPPSSSPFSNIQMIEANQQCQQWFSSLTFEIESPGFPAYYPPNLSCTYTVVKRNPNICGLQLNFVHLDVEPSGNQCREDYLLVDGIKYCNDNRPVSDLVQISFFESKKAILFRSGSRYRVGRKGFLLHARQIDCQADSSRSEGGGKGLRPLSPQPSPAMFGAEKFVFLPSLPSICEICVTEVNGMLQSYDYPNFYPPNVNCTYRVTPLPDNCMVQLHFHQFDFDSTPECDRDYLEINGIRYCGNQLHDVSMILLNKRKEDLSIRMVTNSRGAITKPSFRGFRASYTQLPCLRSDTTQTEDEDQEKRKRPHFTQQSERGEKTVVGKPSGVSPLSPPARQQSTTSSPAELERIYCDQTFDSPRFEIKSPGFPYRYFDHLNCTYSISKSSANVCRLRVIFQYFNIVGEDGYCSGDYLEMQNQRICGVLERYTKKEIAFVQDKINLQLHTNEARTANGFHLVIEQIDCIQGGVAHPKISDEQQMESVVRNPAPPHPPIRSPSFTSSVLVRKPQEPLKYDDDEIGSGLEQTKQSGVKTMTPIMRVVTSSAMDGRSDTQTSTTTTPILASSRRPTKVEMTPHVVYESSPQQAREPPHWQSLEQTSSDDMPSKTAVEDPQYPLRYFSKNITVIEQATTDYGSSSNRPHSASFEPQTWQQAQPQIAPGWSSGPRRSICTEMLIAQMYFELSEQDLLETSPSDFASITCQLHIRKAKPNICQLDVQFIRYWTNNDTTCAQQYLSVDGERICGEVPANTIKKFWFNRPELFLFVKLNKELQARGRAEQQRFFIKARQVECAHNLAKTESQHHQRPYQSAKVKALSDRTREPGTSYESPSNQAKHLQYLYEQQQQQLPDRSEFQESKPVLEPEAKYNQSCDLIATEQQYTIISPKTTSPPHHCRYLIRKVNLRICAIDIKFVKFRLQELPSDVVERCQAEYLQIDNGAKICGAFPLGHERRYHFLPDEQEKLIYYHLNEQDQAGGDFELQIKQIDDCAKPLTPPKAKLSTPTICDSSSKSVRGSLKSPNYPSPYDHFTSCTYRIQAASPDYCWLQISIKDLDIESDTLLEQRRNPSRSIKCEKDSLEIGTSNGQTSKRICGNDLKHSQYTIPFSSYGGQRMAQLKFMSDASGNGRGFALDYVQEPCQTKSSSSSHENSIKSRLTSPGTKIRVEKMPTDANSLGPNPMRPLYPPNYVSKAHLIKAMDRAQFIKLMMLEQERERLFMNTRENEEVASTTSSIGSTTPTATSTTIAPEQSSLATTETDIITTDASEFIENLTAKITTIDPQGLIASTSTINPETTTTVSETTVKLV